MVRENLGNHYSHNMDKQLLSEKGHCSLRINRTRWIQMTLGKDKGGDGDYALQLRCSHALPN